MLFGWNSSTTQAAVGTQSVTYNGWVHHYSRFQFSDIPSSEFIVVWVLLFPTSFGFSPALASSILPVFSIVKSLVIKSCYLRNTSKHDQQHWQFQHPHHPKCVAEAAAHRTSTPGCQHCMETQQMKMWKPNNEFEVGDLLRDWKAIANMTEMHVYIRSITLRMILHTHTHRRLVL